MKSEREWRLMVDPSGGEPDEIMSNPVPTLARSELEAFIRAIQADTLEAAALDCEADTDEMGRESSGYSNAARIRKLKPGQP